MKLSNKVKVMW